MDGMVAWYRCRDDEDRRIGLPTRRKVFENQSGESILCVSETEESEKSICSWTAWIPAVALTGRMGLFSVQLQQATKLASGIMSQCSVQTGGRRQWRQGMGVLGRRRH
jgi:hypothetical protein